MLAVSLADGQAPEFSRLRGWLNTQPLTVEGLKGKVVLLDFWTFSCVNCIRSLPQMRRLHMMYAGDRFVLIGVHTPEFEFEKDPESVANAVTRFRLEYPVAIDSENATWRLYGNQYWPRQTLIDARGRVRWEHAGEGDYDKMEEKIRELLKETGAVMANPDQTNRVDHASRSYNITPEIYLGGSRSEGFGNGQVCVPGSCSRYIDTKEHSRDIPYLSGDWTQFPEYVMHETHEPGYVLLKYCLLYTSPSPRDLSTSRMPSSA